MMMMRSRNPYIKESPTHDHHDGRPMINVLHPQVTDPLLHMLVRIHGREKEYAPWVKRYLREIKSMEDS